MAGFPRDLTQATISRGATGLSKVYTSVRACSVAEVRNLEINARRLCAIDLADMGYSRDEAAAPVDRFWPVIAYEIRGGGVFRGE
ncbi:hypothetical protein GCM10017653_27400 [Ancylobacter defluvii]|uniref:Uncharacterized protein n=1 Tax=Ancylobacter defluvii TaxID=1282440 RepID=A0A9W6NBJ8_9HYPH|nr:hypothetical protein GCM10017653_27400 [Ancylobacter defluvii]